jgi:hypothetical protein
MTAMQPLHNPPDVTEPSARPLAPGWDPQQRRLWVAVLLSLLLHGLLFSLTIGGQGFGRPGFGLPWQERRIEVPDLQVFMVPAPTRPPQPEAGVGRRSRACGRRYVFSFTRSGRD